MKYTYLCLMVLFLAACSSQPKSPPPLVPQESTAHKPSTKSKASSQPKATRRPAVQKQAPVTTSTDDYQQILAKINHWQVQGKLGIRLPDNSGSLYYNWMQEPNQYAIHLSGPLGQGATWIRGTDHQASITTGDKLPVYARNPQALMQKTLGWSLPVEELYYWARGLTSPDSPVTAKELDEEERLRSLQQSGWQITYQRYKTFSGWPLPQKMIVEREGIRLTLVMKNWKIY
jgi:outer membrane lipoprotein LolB